MKKFRCIQLFFVLFMSIVSFSSVKALSFDQIAPSNDVVTFERIIMQNDEQKAIDAEGAGCQWPVSLESSTDGGLMLYGIDVAGLYKSTDHGNSWTLAVSGMESRGVGMFAIDPYNSNHVLALGLGTSVGGMHVSYDQANTWKKTISLPTNGERYLWDGLEFDATSYDETSGITKDVYYSTPYNRDSGIRTSPNTKPTSKSTLHEDEVGLYKSTDGGETFNLIINDARLADGIVKVTAEGNVYVGNQHGLFLIDKANNTIQASYLENDASNDYSKGITGLDVVGNTIYAQTWDGIYTLASGTLTKITNENYHSDKWPQFLEVSQANPNHMIYQERSNVNNYYVNRSMVSFDGGATWQMSNNEKNSLFFKSNWEGREKLFIIDPANDDNVIAFGSDDLVRSIDGGLNFKQTKSISNMMQGGKFNFNYYDPDLLLFSAQDYTGVVSYDGGQTYRALNIPDKGNFYGGFAADKDTFYGFANKSWNGGTLTVTHDGGDTWTDTGLAVESSLAARYYSSLQSPTDPNVLFAAEYYSKDKGYTWNKMNGCASVFTFNYVGDRELYGTDYDGNIVVSYDNGDSWTKVSDINWNKSTKLQEQIIIDAAYDQVNNYAYVVVQSKISNGGSNPSIVEEVYKYDINNNVATKLNIPVDNERGHMRQKSIAIDPNSTSVIYVGGAGDYFSSSTGLIRSVDGGATWSVLTTANNDNYPALATNQGGYEIAVIRVNPYDGRVWTANGCYGYETFNPPYDPSLLNHEKPADHTITYMYDDQVVNQALVRNNDKHNYVYDEDGLTFVSWYKDKDFTEEFKNGSLVYDDMTLYAKMEKSIKIKFYDRNKLLWKIDLDDYDSGDKAQIPLRDGYAFAGWYSDQNLTSAVDFSAINENTNVYAGWYKVTEDIFDINKKDISNYISYSNYQIQDAKEVDNNAIVNDRSLHVKVDKNSTYFITFKMDNRFRLGMRKNKFTYYPHNPVLEPYIDEKDINGRQPVNEYVRKVIETNDYTYLLINYYSWNGSRDFMDIKNTFNIYKIEDQDVQANNQKIDGLDHEILDGAEQAYTINQDDHLTFRASGEAGDFAYMEIDGQNVDEAHYTLDSNSIMITLKQEFLDQLTPDQTHIMNIIYQDGGEVAVTFSVLLGEKTPQGDDPSENDPKEDSSQEPVIDEEEPSQDGSHSNTPAAISQTQYIATKSQTVTEVVNDNSQKDHTDTKTSENATQKDKTTTKKVDDDNAEKTNDNSNHDNELQKSENDVYKYLPILLVFLGVAVILLAFFIRRKTHRDQ